MFRSGIYSLSKLSFEKTFNVKCMSIVITHNNKFSSKPPNQPLVKQVEGEEGPKKKRKTQIIPKVTLISPGDEISITTLEEAQKISKRRDLKLVKIVDVDSKTQRSVYQLMTGSQYHAEELKQREERKKQKENDFIKGEKMLMMSAAIAEHDLSTNVKKILKWINKSFEVHIVVNGDSSSMGKAEHIYKFLEDNLKNESRFVQKRTKGSDLKFQIVPPKRDKDNDKKS